MKKRICFLFSFIILLVINRCSILPNIESDFAKTWMLVSFQDCSKQELIDKNAKIILSSTKSYNTFAGKLFLGCNSFKFKIKFLDKEKVKVYHLKNEQNNCIAGYFEKDFIKKFNEMNFFSKEGHFLILKTNNGEIIKFLAEDWD